MKKQMVSQESASSRESNVLRRFTVQIPGSTSNLGPGFDTLGLAISLKNTVTIELLERECEGAAVSLSSQTNQTLPLTRENHIFKVAAAEMGKKAQLLERVRINIDSSIPIGSGLGSSGTATLAGCCAARWLCEEETNHNALLRAALQYEGHPDNVSPSLFGGLTVSAVDLHGHVTVACLSWPEAWQLIFIVPERELSTRQAREALPSTVPLANAVFNVQHVSMLLAAVATADEEKLRVALDDRLHQPYREKLIPELPMVRAIVRELPAIGCCLSGAGPTVMVIVDSSQSGVVCERLAQALSKERAAVMPLAVASEGLKVIHE